MHHVRHKERLKEAAVVIGKAKFVEPGVGAELLTWLRPCVASDHQLYLQRGMCAMFQLN